MANKKVKASEVEDKFSKIIQDALSEADQVKCPMHVYRQELRGWISQVQTAIHASEESEKR